jgi:hypothetical protein
MEDTAALDAVMATNILKKFFCFVHVNDSLEVCLLPLEFYQISSCSIIASINTDSVSGFITIIQPGNLAKQLRGKWESSCTVNGLGQVSRHGWIGAPYEGFSVSSESAYCGLIMVGRLNCLMDQRIMGSIAMAIGYQHGITKAESTLV